jgi:hypothetical protein
MAPKYAGRSGNPSVLDGGNASAACIALVRTSRKLGYRPPSLMRHASCAL